MKKLLLYIFVLLIAASKLSAQKTSNLSLQEVIKMATDSSLAAFKAKNLYLASYWEYRTYVSQKRPQINLNTVPMDYNRALIKRYNSELNIDEYREQQNIYSAANISISQNLPFSGGSLYLNSNLGYLQNFGKDGYQQFSTIPINVGFSQRLFGFNNFKWQKKIEPLKYEKSKREYLRSVEIISEQAVDYFFSLIIAKMRIEMTRLNKVNADTLYRIGLKRFEIASFSQADVLTLRVDVLNAENSLADAEKQLKKAQFEFMSYLRIPESETIDLQIPDKISDFQVNFDKTQQFAYENNPELLNYQQLLLEAKKNVEQTRRDNMFNATLNASYGFNQQNTNVAGAYKNPLDQQNVLFSLSIPLVDWGQNKGRYNMARKNMEAVNATVEQALVDFKQSIFMAVTDFNMQYRIVITALETRDVAKQAYETTKQRFIIGKADVNSINLALKRQDEANLDYLNSLRYYWKYYYILRRFTLYDFERNVNLLDGFDQELGLR
ncbi:MAG: TolC family protein [Bacteroidales bacterium]|nr:MAG: TolC family protein [Bacteroidales bacterium]